MLRGPQKNGGIKTKIYPWGSHMRVTMTDGSGINRPAEKKTESESAIGIDFSNTHQ